MQNSACIFNAFSVYYALTREVKMKTKKCKYCGKEFEVNRKWQKYCSSDCRFSNYWMRKLKREKKK